MPNGTVPLNTIDNDRFEQPGHYDWADEMADLESGRGFYNRRS